MENAESVKSFNNELASLYECKPPVSKAKMVQVTKAAMKAIKFYKHVVLSVEKFIQKCRPEYKLPGLYVIDSIVRQSRHQFTAEKDLFAPRFAKNISVTFQSLFKCPDEDKQRVVRVVRLWMKNAVFQDDDLKPILDMAVELGLDVTENMSGRNGGKDAAKKNRTPSSIEKSSPNVAEFEPDFDDKVRSQQAAPSTANLDPAMFSQIQKLSTALVNTQQQKVESDRKLTQKLLADYEYSDEESGGEDVSELRVSDASRTDLSANLAAAAQNLLKNPELLQQIHQMQQSIKGQTTMGFEALHGRFQHPPPPPAAFVAQQQAPPIRHAAFPPFSVSPPPQPPVARSFENQVSNYPPPAEPVPPPLASSFAPSTFGNRMHWPTNLASERLLDRDERKHGSESSRRRSRSRSKERRRRSRSRSRSRSESRDVKRRNRSRSLERRNKEHDRERKKQGLPPMKSKHVSICSRTLWFGRVPTYCEAEEIKEGLKDYGEPTSIDLITPRGCAYVVMPDRKSAFKVLDRLRDSLKVQNRTLKMAWAPGKGVKEYKDGWVVEHGVTYLPWDCLPADLTSLLDGGSLDIESLPDDLKGSYSDTGKLPTPATVTPTIQHSFSIAPPLFPAFAGMAQGPFSGGALPPSFAPSMVPAPVPNPSTALPLHPGPLGLPSMPPPMPVAPPSMAAVNVAAFRPPVASAMPATGAPKVGSAIPSLLSSPMPIYGQATQAPFGLPGVAPSYARPVAAEAGHGRAGFFSVGRPQDGAFRGRGRGGRGFDRGRPFRGRGNAMRQDWPPPGRFEHPSRNGRSRWRDAEEDHGRSDLNNDDTRRVHRSRWDTESDRPAFPPPNASDYGSSIPAVVSMLPQATIESSEPPPPGE